MYCNVEELAEAFGNELILVTRLPNDPPGQLNRQRVELAIRQASAEIDTYLAGRYQLPLSVIPDIIKYIAMDVARYRVNDRVDDKHPASIRYADRVKLLRSVASGTASLGLSNNAEPALTADTVQVSVGRNDWGQTW